MSPRGRYNDSADEDARKAIFKKARIIRNLGRKHNLHGTYIRNLRHQKMIARVSQTDTLFLSLLNISWRTNKVSPVAFKLDWLVCSGCSAGPVLFSHQCIIYFVSFYI